VGLVVSIAMIAGAQPRGGSATGGLADTEWKGMYGSGTRSNQPASLHVFSRNGSLSGTLTYDGYEETVAITATGPRTLRIKGVSYRDLRGGRSFFLDTFTAQISPDGRSLNGTGGDTNSVVSNQWLRLQQVDSRPAEPARPAPENFVRSMIGTKWDGAIAESQKGGTPAQMRIVQQNGNPTAILVYDQFEEILALNFTAPSGIHMVGSSVRDLTNQRRGFKLDTAQGEVSPDGHRIQGQIAGVHFEFRRVN
jgi:hypothetical protein